MSVFGIGIDVVEIERIERMLDEYGDKFIGRMFTEVEQAYCSQQNRPALHYAARFAAKEAISKAFGTGIGKDLEWLDMEIRRNEAGAPTLHLSGSGKEFADQNEISEVLISLTHAHAYAAANAVAMKR